MEEDNNNNNNNNTINTVVVEQEKEDEKGAKNQRKEEEEEDPWYVGDNVQYPQENEAEVSLVISILAIILVPFVLLLERYTHVTRNVRWGKVIKRRKQHAMVALFVILLPSIALCYLYSFSLVLMVFEYPHPAYLMIIYWMWILFIDRSAENGKRPAYLRKLEVLRYFVDYFPIKLIKTTDLDPSRKYVFAYSPHGIIGVGAVGAFATEAAKFPILFPGIDIRLLTLSMNTNAPFIREIMLGLGICSASRKSCDNILKKGPGSAICLLVGGAEESLDTKQGTYSLLLGRKGFIRVALSNGADIVPVLAFGENDTFNTIHAERGTKFRQFQQYMQKKMGFAIPIFYGRGFFNGKFGILPTRTPVYVTVGTPIVVENIPPHLLAKNGEALSTTEEGRLLVDEYHAKYVKGMEELFERYKDEYAPNRIVDTLKKIE